MNCIRAASSQIIANQEALAFYLLVPPPLPHASLPLIQLSTSIPVSGKKDCASEARVGPRLDEHRYTIDLINIPR